LAAAPLTGRASAANPHNLSGVVYSENPAWKNNSMAYSGVIQIFVPIKNYLEKLSTPQKLSYRLTFNFL
jgi:hypothetical protein